MITENLDAFLNDFGVPVVFGMVTGLGILDQPDVNLGQHESTEYALTVKTSVFSGLAFGSSITVDGVSYTVREAQKLDDGTFSRILISKT